jgi:hypothetical protein
VAATHLPDERLDATGAAIDLVESDLANDLAAVVPATTLLAMRYIRRQFDNAYFRSFLIFSISPGSFAAKVSFSDCNWHC